MTIIKPSISMLPLEDLSAELRSNKAGRKFMTREDKAIDVKQVAGVNAENIAVAVSSLDRTTIENALNLDGRPASEYLNKEEGDKLLGVTDELSAIYANEIQNTRDELYQLKAELNKNGFIEDKISYEGFIDTFKKHNKKYEGFICNISRDMLGATDELYLDSLDNIRYFEVGKKFVIKRKDIGREIIVESRGVDGSGKVTFEPSTDILDMANMVEIWKTSGEYIRDSFSFSEVKEDVANSLKERHFMHGDDTHTEKLKINKSRTGYAAYFKVPKNAAGALTRFSINTTIVGSPDSLVCHVIDKNHMFDFKNIDEAKAKGYVITSSQAISASESMYEESDRFGIGKEVSFNFYNINTNKYPILKSDADSYIFVIECLSATEYDYWNILLSYYDNDSIKEDLQRNNKLYRFENLLDDSMDTETKAIQVDESIKNYDLIFSVMTKEVQDKDEVGNQSGVYTGKIVLPKPIDVSRARISTRINREGCYFVDSHNQEYTIFTLSSETNTSHSCNDTRFMQGDTIVIGNQKAIVKRASGNRIELKAPAYIDHRILRFYTTQKYNENENKFEEIIRIPVYRVNYEMKIKPSFIDWNTWDEFKNEFKTTDITSTPIPLELTKIVPHGNSISSISELRKSDRLLFECNFGEEDNGVAKFANEFEFEIFWNSSFTAEEINAQKDTADDDFKELIGRLYELTLTFDKNY